MGGGEEGLARRGTIGTYVILSTRVFFVLFFLILVLFCFVFLSKEKENCGLGRGDKEHGDLIQGARSSSRVCPQPRSSDWPPRELQCLRAKTCPGAGSGKRMGSCSCQHSRRGQPSPACLGGKQEVLPGQPGSICHYLSAGPGGMSPMCAQEDGMGLSAGSIPTAPGAQLCPHVRSTSEFQEPLFFKDS